MPKTKSKRVNVRIFPPAKTPEDFERLRRAMKVQEHRNAIVAIDAARPLMGDAWAVRSIAYRLGCLERLGVKP